MTPISSMCPASMIVGLPPPFASARLFPATSPDTFANCFACSRHTLAGAASNPDGPGVSRSFFRKESDSDEIIRLWLDSWLDGGKFPRERSNIALPPRRPLRTRTTLACRRVCVDLISNEQKDHPPADSLDRIASRGRRPEHRDFRTSHWHQLRG